MKEKEKVIPKIECPICKSNNFRRKGFNRSGSRRFLCNNCGKYYSIPIDIYNAAINTDKYNKENNDIWKTDKEIELENNNSKFNKVTVKINGFLKSTLNNKKEEKVENKKIEKKEEKRGFKFIYLHGPNVDAFKRLANDLDLVLELKDASSSLYKISNPHYKKN